MAVPWLMFAQVLMDKKANAAARENAIENERYKIQARAASRHGFPTDVLDAAEFQKKLRDEDEKAKSEWLTKMLSFGASQMGGGGEQDPYGMNAGWKPYGEQAQEQGGELARERYADMNAEATERMFDDLNRRQPQWLRSMSR